MMNNCLFLTVVTMLTFSFPTDQMIKILELNDRYFSYEIKSIPASIFTEMSEITGELPFRRLIFAVHSKDKKEWLIYYEKGGRSHYSALAHAILGDQNEVEAIYNLVPETTVEIIRDKKTLCKRLKGSAFMIIYDNGEPLPRAYLSF